MIKKRIDAALEVYRDDLERIKRHAEDLTQRIKKRDEKFDVWKDRVRELEVHLERIVSDAEAMLQKAESREKASKAADNRALTKLEQARKLAGEEDGGGAEQLRLPEPGEMDALEAEEIPEGPGYFDDFDERRRRIAMSRGR